MRLLVTLLRLSEEQENGEGRQSSPDHHHSFNVFFLIGFQSSDTQQTVNDVVKGVRSNK